MRSEYCCDVRFKRATCHSAEHEVSKLDADGGRRVESSADLIVLTTVAVWQIGTDISVISVV